MPRKPTLSKRKISVSVEGRAINVTLFPPSGSRTSWYAYWTGLSFNRSTGHVDFDEAVKAVEGMLRNGGRPSRVADGLLTDAEFEEIQRRHYGKKTDPDAKRRAEKSLRECMDAISAFRLISGITPVTMATADDCERFQREALQKRRNWRVQYAENGRSMRRRARQGEAELLSPNTVLKWSVALQAAFERANRNAGKKCVRGVVPEGRLLTANPWNSFTWIEGVEKELRQFDHGELLSLLDHFEREWPGLSFAPAFAKVCLWSWGRRDEISSLRWNDLKPVGNEFHFETTGKWGVTKWFRIPELLFRELEALAPRSEFVFGCYNDQIRDFYLRRGRNAAVRRVGSEFVPVNLGEWMYRQISEWSKELPKGSAYLHVFRKTSLQYARTGEDVNRAVASDAHVTERVMMQSYARERDEELRSKSNRTYRRIRGSLSVEVATRYGYEEKPADRLAERLDLARSQGDWAEVGRLAQELAGIDGREC